MRERLRTQAPILLLSLFFLLTGCSAGGEQSTTGQSDQSQKQAAGKPTYPDIKTMVLDILHSKEGMTTLKDTMSSPEFKRSAAITEVDVQAALEKALSQGQNKSFLSSQMKDTKFAAAVVQSSRPQMVEIQKGLMHDPEYQKELLTLMQSPEFQQSQFELLKSPEYRKEIMKIMTEALQEPTFRLLFMDSMKEAVKAAGGGDKQKMGQQQQGKGSKKGGQDKKEKGGSEGGGGGEESGESGGGEGSESGESGGSSSSGDGS